MSTREQLLVEGNPRVPYLREKTKHLTTEPGVYLMKTQDEAIIYIGKAKNLKNRVTSYFRESAVHSPKVATMVSHVWDYDFIVTESEYEALLLECSLIKQHKPHYNILLKDDKGYHYIKISDEDYPHITAEKQRGAEGRYLGPYTSGFVTKSAVEEVNQVFRLPLCSRQFRGSFRRGRPCLNYHIQRCMGVCRGTIPKTEYQAIIAQAVEYLQTGSGQSIERMQMEMEQASERLDFERAAILRDRLRAIQKVAYSQKIIDQHYANADIIAYATSEDTIAVSILVYREGRLHDKRSFHFADTQLDREEFLLQYYQDRGEYPRQVLLDEEIEDTELLATLLTQWAKHRVKIHVPQRGSGLELVRMSKQNAVESIAVQGNRTGKELLALEALGELLGLPKPPRYIESYDISNLGSDAMVAGMVVFEHGRPLKKAYKRFAIKESQNQDDYACMQEVIRRRLSHIGEDKDPYFSRKPDLILLDGGKGHVSAVRPIVDSLAPDVALFGMVKDGKHRTRAIAVEGGEISISQSQAAFHLLTRIQDEVHRFAVSYLHSKHSKKSFASELCKVEGIGEKLSQKIMLHFKTKSALEGATVEELQSVGIPHRTATRLYQFLHESE